MADELGRLNAILEELGRLDGIQGLRLATDGTGGMELKNGVKVLFEYVSDSGRLFACARPARAHPTVCAT